MSRLRRHWFALSYLVVLAIALAWPRPGAQHGPLHLDTLKPWCIGGIFLCAGLMLSGRRLGESVVAWRAHLTIQGLSFVVAPLLGVAMAWCARAFDQPEAVQAGLIMLGCLPTTIGSCVVLTGLAGGNQGLAVVDSVLGNLLGLILTPVLISILLSRPGGGLLTGVVGPLILLAVVPVLLGQLLRWPLGDWLDQQRARIGVLSGCMLLLVLLGIFSDLAQQGLFSGAAQLTGLCLLLHLALLGLGWLLAYRFARPDRIAITVTASQKTAALGIPLISLLFAGDPALPLLLLPLALYHIVQATAGSLMACLQPTRA